MIIFMMGSIKKCYKKLRKRRILSLSLLAGMAIVFLYTFDHSRTKLDPPGVIVPKLAGLGNQLFYYACGYSLAKNLQVPLYLEAPPGNVLDPQAEIFYESSSRPYVLHKFALVYDKLVQSWYTSYWPFKHSVFQPRDFDLFKFYQNNDTQITQKFRSNDTLIQIKDYCQHELFFSNYTKEISSMFQLQLTPEELARPQFRRWINAITLAGGGSVGVHVRRGDYSQSQQTPYSFYHVAIQMMLEKLNSSNNSTGKNISFFVFSDDMDLVKGELLKGINLPGNVAIHFVSCSRCTTLLEEFYLMTLCRHLITANSTFSWWAGWLIGNHDKIIIAPEFNPSTFQRDYGDEEETRWKRYELGVFYPKEWIVLDPYNNNLVKMRS